MHGSLAPMTIPPKNRKGRKRKSGRREPSGRVARATVDYRAMAGNNPDRRGLPEALRTHERAGSELGRLNLRYQAHEAREAHLKPCQRTPPPGISEHEYEAGCRYAVIVGAWRAMSGVPAHLVGVGKGFGCDPEYCAAYPDECVCQQRQDRYDDAYCSIRTHAAHLAVNAVAVHDQAIAPDLVVHLREGLAALARHFGLIGRRR